MKTIFKNITNSFNKRIEIKEKRKNLYQIFLPIYHEDGDMIDLFIESVDNKFILCDYGLTLQRLSYNYDIDTENKESILQKIITENEFFDFHAKYEGGSKEVTPAEVDESIAEQIRMEAQKAYQVFNCHGVIRIDFIYNETQRRPYLLEINTVPGQSAASIVPQQVAAMGWTLKDFYAALLEECI